MPLNARAIEQPTEIEDGLTRGDAQPGAFETGDAQGVRQRLRGLFVKF
jgi:hypothetical protein